MRPKPPPKMTIWGGSMLCWPLGPPPPSCCCFSFLGFPFSLLFLASASPRPPIKPPRHPFGTHLAPIWHPERPGRRLRFPVERPLDHGQLDAQLHLQLHVGRLLHLRPGRLRGASRPPRHPGPLRPHLPPGRLGQRRRHLGDRLRAAPHDQRRLVPQPLLGRSPLLLGLALLGLPAGPRPPLAIGPLRLQVPAVPHHPQHVRQRPPLDGHQRRPLRLGDAPGVVPEPPHAAVGAGGVRRRVVLGRAPHPPVLHLPHRPARRFLRQDHVRLGLRGHWAAPARHRARHRRHALRRRFLGAVRGDHRLLRPPAGPRAQQGLRQVQKGHQAHLGGHRQLLRVLVALPRGGVDHGLHFSSQRLVQGRPRRRRRRHRRRLRQQLHQPHHLRGDGAGLQGQAAALLEIHPARRPERRAHQHPGGQQDEDQVHRGRPERQHHHMSGAAAPALGFW